MERYKVIDNFLPEKEYQKIKAFINHNQMPWYYMDSLVYGKEEEKKDKDAWQFTNTLYRNNLPYGMGIEIIAPILNKLEVICLMRAKFNFNPIKEKAYESLMHVDDTDMAELNIRHTVGVLHFNNSNGVTELEMGEEENIFVESKENRLVLFAGDLWHRGISSTDSNRILLNINFMNKDTNSFYK